MPVERGHQVVPLDSCGEVTGGTPLGKTRWLIRLLAKTRYTGLR